MISLSGQQADCVTSVRERLRYSIMSDILLWQARRQNNHHNLFKKVTTTTRRSCQTASQAKPRTKSGAKYNSSNRVKLSLANSIAIHYKQSTTLLSFTRVLRPLSKPKYGMRNFIITTR